MNTPQTLTHSLQCILSDLSLSSPRSPETDAVLESGQPFRLSVNLSFTDTAEGNLISLLMPQELVIRVNFSARSYSGPGREIDLGYVTLTTATDVFSYTPQLLIQNGPESVGLNPEEAYQIKAIVRVGMAPFASPTLWRGFINGLNLPADTSKAEIGAESIKVGAIADTGVNQPEVAEKPKSNRTRGTRSKSARV
jgi:hypothetical protein